MITIDLYRFFILLYLLKVRLAIFCREWYLDWSAAISFSFKSICSFKAMDSSFILSETDVSDDCISSVSDIFGVSVVFGGSGIFDVSIFSAGELNG